jgi:hypothetical protein
MAHSGILIAHTLESAEFARHPCDLAMRSAKHWEGTALNTIRWLVHVDSVPMLFMGLYPLPTRIGFELYNVLNLQNRNSAKQDCTLKSAIMWTAFETTHGRNSLLYNLNMYEEQLVTDEILAQRQQLPLTSRDHVRPADRCIWRTPRAVYNRIACHFLIPLLPQLALVTCVRVRLVASITH